MSRSYLRITPSNQPANGIISYRDGMPLVQFMIGEQDRMLVGSGLRLCGEFEAVKEADASGLVAADGVSINPRLGILACIDQLTISSKRTSQTMESIRHYGRFLSSFVGLTRGFNDTVTQDSARYCSMANEAQTYSNLIASKVNKAEFSLPLQCGLFSGEDHIPLSATWGVQGLIIQINLAPDSNVFKCLDSNTAPYYRLHNLHLTCEVINPSPDQLSRYMSNGAFEYNTISSYYDVVNASYATINFNLGLSRVLGAWINFIPTSNTNNYTENGFRLGPLQNADGTAAPIYKINFLRGGNQYPLNYLLEADRIRGDSEAQRALVMGVPGAATGWKLDPRTLRTYMNAVNTFTRVSSTSINGLNTSNLDKTNSLYDISIASPAVLGNINAANLGKVNNMIDGGEVFGIGVAYDQISDIGSDFSSQQFGCTIDSQLVSNNPHGAYLFIHSKATLTYGQAGISISM